MGGDADIDWRYGYPSTVNTEAETNFARSVAIDLVGKDKVEDFVPTMGGEDFALYQEQVPGCFIWMGTSGTEEWHHPRFTLNEEALPVSAALFAEAAVHALEAWR